MNSGCETRTIGLTIMEGRFIVFARIDYPAVRSFLAERVGLIDPMAGAFIAVKSLHDGIRVMA